ncbi:MAG TPA: hypothetical protein VKS21_01640 [Spirochaetota bacterium]|nr:hypothetical protein [Spirochaetota bacterium]
MRSLIIIFLITGTFLRAADKHTSGQREIYGERYRELESRTGFGIGYGKYSNPFFDNKMLNHFDLQLKHYRNVFSTCSIIKNIFVNYEFILVFSAPSRDDYSIVNLNPLNVDIGLTFPPFKKGTFIDPFVSIGVGYAGLYKIINKDTGSKLRYDPVINLRSKTGVEFFLLQQRLALQTDFLWCYYFFNNKAVYNKKHLFGFALDVILYFKNRN